MFELYSPFRTVNIPAHGFTYTLFVTSVTKVWTRYIAHVETHPYAQRVTLPAGYLQWECGDGNFRNVTSVYLPPNHGLEFEVEYVPNQAGTPAPEAMGAPVA